ncbi:MAG: GAF domain-containing protein, partial [Betaproteobacteria bacterium]
MKPNAAKPNPAARARQLAAELALINRIQHAMAAKLGFQAIVDLVGDTLREMFGSEDLSIRWWDPEADTIVQLYCVEHGKHLPKGPPAKVRATNKPLTRLLYQGIGSYMGTREEQRAAGIGAAVPGTDWCLSILGAPIRGAERVLGAIVIENHAREHAFGDAELQALTTIGSTLGTALENVRLFDETQRLLKDSEQRSSELEVINSIQHGIAAELDFQAIVDLVGDKLRDIFRTGNMSILWRDDADVIHALYSHEHGKRLTLPSRPYQAESKLAQALLRGKPIVLKDRAAMDALGLEVTAGTDASLSCTFVPIFVRERLTASIVLESFEREDAYGDAEVRLLSTVAASMGVALQNARLYNGTKEALERQTATAEVLKVISRSPTDVQPVFDAIVDAALRLLPATLTALLQREGDAYRLAATASTDVTRHKRTVDGHPPLVPIDPAANFPSRVFVTKQLLHIPDWSAIELPAHEASVFAGTGVHSSLMLPLVCDGDCVGVLAIAHTQRHAYDQGEIALAQSFVDQAVIAIQNTRLFNETQQALSHQTATSDILRVISASPTDTQPVFDAIVETAVTLLGCDRAAFSRVTGNCYVPCAIATPAGRENDRWTEPVPIDATANFPSQALVSKATVHIPDWDAIELPPRQKMVRDSTGARASLAIPLLRDGDAIGVLMLFRNHAGGFDANEIALAESFRDQAVIAIQNVRLFNETRDALEQQTATAEILRVISGSVTDTQPVFDAIVDSCQRLLGGKAVALAMPVGDMIQTVAFASDGADSGKGGAMKPWPLDRGSGAGTCILESRTIAVADTAEGAKQFARMPQLAIALGYRSALFVPLLRDGAAIGCLAILRAAAGEFDANEISLVQTFADQAVIAIENARLFNETQKALARQTASAEVLQVISSSIADTRPVFDTIVRNAARLCDGMFANLFLFDGELLHFGATSDIKPEFLSLMHKRYPMRPDATQISGRVILSQSVVVLNDALADPDYDHAMSFAGRWRRMLGAPMLREGKPIGVIIVGWDEPGPVAKSNEDLLKTFADQAVIAIENARLFNETKEALEQQTATAEVLKVISTSVADTAPVFGKILDSCQHLFASEELGIFVVGDDDRVSVGEWRGSAHATLRRHGSMRLEETFTGQAIRERRTIQVGDAASLAASSESARRAVESVGNYSAIYSPMLWEGRGVGAICVFRQPPRAFSVKETALLGTFADQAVIAIQNARLFREAQQA